jgi:hypothetical protein
MVVVKTRQVCGAKCRVFVRSLAFKGEGALSIAC